MISRKILQTSLTKWIPLAMSISLICGIIYVVGQQNIRQTANDPQIEMARDSAYDLAQGKTTDQVMNLRPIEISKEESPFMMVLNESLIPLVTSGLLDGKLPVIPSGVFDYAKLHGEDRVTWQPRAGVRQAIVVTYFTGEKTGYVVAGKSLKESERRIDALTQQMAIAWAVVMATSLATITTLEILK